MEYDFLIVRLDKVVPIREAQAIADAIQLLGPVAEVKPIDANFQDDEDAAIKLLNRVEQI